VTTTTPTLTQAREALALALTAVDGLNVRPRPGVKYPRPGDGWVTVGQMEPADYTRTTVTLVAVIILGADETSAEEHMETWAVNVIDTATTADFPVSDVVLEPISLVIESGTALNAMTLTLTTEVAP
jgi:hypothetical protein